MNDIQNTHKEIDIVGLFLLLWGKRKRIITNCFIGGVISIVVAFSIPKEYTSTVVMAPEFSKSSASGGIGALASMAGINMNGMSGNDDALYPELYPQIVSSTPFLCDLMNLQVETQDGELSTTLYNYLGKHEKKAWWVSVAKMPLEMLVNMFKEENPLDSIIPQATDINLTRKQHLLLIALNDRIGVSVDKGNSVITLNVTMQDPKIASCVASVVADNLQEYIGTYRSAKARKDLSYTEKLYNESKEKFYAVQQTYAEYSDQHKGVVLLQNQIEQKRLSDEMDLAFNVYNQMAQQLEMARAKVAESTPICVVMQPAIIPVKASSPKKIMIGFLFVFLAFFGTSAWIIIKDRIIDTRKNAETE